MIKSSKTIYPIYVLTDLFLFILAFFTPYILKYSSVRELIAGQARLPDLGGYCVISLLWFIFLIITFARRGHYATDRSLTMPKEIMGVTISILNAGVLIAGVIFFSKYQFFSREIFFKCLFFLCFYLNFWRTAKRLILRKLIAEGFKNVNVLIVGAGKVGKSIAEEISKNLHWGFRVVGFLDDAKIEPVENSPILGKLNDFSVIVRKYFIDEVIISIPSERTAVLDLLKEARKMRLGLRIIPDSFEDPLPELYISYLGIIPLLTYKERRHHPAEFALKRLLDLLVSLFLAIILSPLFLIISLLIKMDSPGPLLYIRKRTGFKGRIFNFYKFRSMVKEADNLKKQLLDKNESKGNLIFKIRKDPRVTRAGAFLRRYSLDELPQILNVLKGDMSLIGPRPFPVEESEKFSYEHLQRLSVRPGITGLAQIRGRSDLSSYRWIKWDLWYVNNWSFWLDLLIIWWTIPVVLKGKGAY